MEFEQRVRVLPPKLLSAWREFLKNKRRRKDIERFSLHLTDNILDLHKDLVNTTYRHGPYQAFRINDPKPRDIHKASVRDRLLHHAIYRVLYPYFDQRFIFDSYSCRLAKGTHRAINRFRDYARKVSKNHTRTVWVLKCGIESMAFSACTEYTDITLNSTANHMKKLDIGKKALAIHKKLRGKVAIMPKASVKNKADLSVYYTPGVAAVSSYVAKHKDKLRDYTMKGNTIAIVSDGSAVLGLGNIGPEGALPVMEGKAMLFKTLAGVDAFPIVLATQDTEAIIQTVKNISPVFGGINLEDIAAPQCFEIERRLRAELPIPVLHYDQHGTAMVVLAGIINALKAAKKVPRKSTVVVSGAGAAGNAIAKILLKYGVGDLIMVDSKGIVCLDRKDMNPFKQVMAGISNKRKLSGSLSVALIGADVFIGVSKGNTVTAEHIRSMNKGAIVFALANPTPEIMPDIAQKAGALVVATGRSDFPNQVNNSLGFPGIFRGALDNKVQCITDDMLIEAAKNLAALIKKPTVNNIIPDTFDPRVVKAVAKAIR